MPKNILLAALAGLVVLLSTTFCSLTPRPALQFMPDKMPDATVGYPYNVEILVAGNVTPVGNYSISTGRSRPDWISAWMKTSTPPGSPVLRFGRDV